MACKICDIVRRALPDPNVDPIERVRRGIDIVRKILDNEQADLILDPLMLTPPGRAVRAGRTGVALGTKVARSPAAKKAAGKLSKALKKVNSKARKKSGDLKKGWNQGRIMKEAHKLARRMR